MDHNKNSDGWRYCDGVQCKQRGIREIDLSGLPPGEYKLIVEADDGYGGITKKEQIVKIEIEAEQKWDFTLTAVLIVILAAAVSVIIMVRRKRSANV